MITSVFVVDWLLISISIFNSLLLLWLAVVVFLNAERRTRGLWLLHGGLLVGTLFFVSHTVILGHELTVFGSQDLEVWWRVGWYPVILAPFSWYVVILWYSGFWEKPGTVLRRRHRIGLILTSIYAVGLLGFVSTRHPVPTYLHLTQLDFSEPVSIYGFPLLFAVYPPFSMVCILLPLDALRYTVPSQRIMSDLARQRARPWLVSTSLVLLLVSLLLAGFMAWVAHQTRVRYTYLFGIETTRVVALFDLLLETLIALGIILLGQSVVSHEIFTSTTLPRRGFFRQWRNTILLAAAVSGSVGYALNWQVLPIFSLLLATVLMIVFYALFSWRSFVEREQFMTRLRPFVSSQRLMQYLVSTEEDASSRADTLFRAICQDVLGTAQAYLIPLGVLAPLAGAPLVYPRTAPRPTFRLSPDLFPSPNASIVTLDPTLYPTLQWAIPLWSERGLIGALLLGPKLGGSLYTQEEIEMARASAERIVDTLAGEQVARRLMEIQRRRFAETRVLDLRTRRTLHDDILPALHTAVLRLSSLSQTDPVIQETIRAMSDVHHQISDLIHAGAASAIPADSHLTKAIQTMVQEEFAAAFNSISWRLPDDLPPLDPLVQEVVFGAAREAVRNAAVHGRGENAGRRLNLKVEIRYDGQLLIVIGDDGVGLSYQSSSANNSPTGSGGGLTLHSTMMAIVGGYLTVESPAKGGTQVTISLPLDGRAWGQK